MYYFSALLVWCLVTVSIGYVIKDDTNLTPGAMEVFRRLGLGRGELSMQVSEGARKMGESPIYYIKLPPSSYYYSPKKNSNKPIKKVPISFHNNGKPQKVYHWTQRESTKRPIYIKRTPSHKQVYPQRQTIHIKTSRPKQQTNYVKPSIPFRQAQSMDERYSIVKQPKPVKQVSAQFEQLRTHPKLQESFTSIQTQTKETNLNKTSSNLSSPISEPIIIIKSQEGNLNKPVTSHAKLEFGTEAPQPMIIKATPTFPNAEVSSQQSHTSGDKPKPVVIKSSVSFIKPYPIPVKVSTSGTLQRPTSKLVVLNSSISSTKPESKLVVLNSSASPTKPDSIPGKTPARETQHSPIIRIGKTPTRKSNTLTTRKSPRRNYRYLAKGFKYNGRPDSVYIWRPDEVIHINKSI